MHRSGAIAVTVLGAALLLGIAGSIVAIATSSHVEPASPAVVNGSSSLMVTNDHDADDVVEVGPSDDQDIDD